MTKICVSDYYTRIGIVFYTQQKRHSYRWEGRGFQPRRSVNSYILRYLSDGGRHGGAKSPALPAALEDGLRRRVYRFARPRMWERLKYCLDEEGRYHPEWAEEFRRVR